MGVKKVWYLHMQVPDFFYIVQAFKHTLLA
ncbi:hypothetical protein J2T18_001806 [Paenibacillus polymyxa]|nr:hypothetical protein [Paenibacillus polymyxa]